MDEFLRWEWASAVVVVVGLASWLIWMFGLRRLLGPTRQDFQGALDKMIDYHYIEDESGEPKPGLSGEGTIREHAPPAERDRWYAKLGLSKPKPHRSQYR